ncbi:hypothetical protein GCM10022294_29870 [Dietzia aurantiaca]
MLDFQSSLDLEGCPVVHSVVTVVHHRALQGRANENPGVPDPPDPVVDESQPPDLQGRGLFTHSCGQPCGYPSGPGITPVDRVWFPHEKDDSPPDPTIIDTKREETAHRVS